jgi:hypothetical protein
LQSFGLGVKLYEIGETTGAKNGLSIGLEGERNKLLISAMKKLRNNKVI